MRQRPKRVAGILLTLIIFGSVFLDYWQYSKEFHQMPFIWLDVVTGIAHAPAQYRIGVVYCAWLIARHAHVGLRHAFTLIDLFAAFTAVFTLFLLLRRSAVYRSANLEGQWFGAAAFIALVQFYMAWLLWYQRPETLTTAAILALTLFFLSTRLSSPAFSLIGILLLTVAQGFVRADVALAMQAGVLLVCVTSAGHGFALRRGLQILTSLVAILTAAGIQYYLMRIKYPQATYGNTPVFQLLDNLHPQVGWIAFFTFIAPFGWTLVTLARRRWQAEAPFAAIFTGAVVFMGMWLVVGRIEEVRIFMPFAIACIPLTAILAMQVFLPAPVKAPPEESAA